VKRELRGTRLGGGLLVLALVAAAGSAAAQQRCEVTIGIDGETAVGALELRVDYGTAPGEFAGEAEAVECIALAEGAYQSANDDGTANQLHLGLLSVPGVALPSDLWRCTFDASSGTPDAGVFPVTVVDALDTSLEEIDVEAGITAIACDEASECGNGIVEADEECDTAGASTACNADCELTQNSQRCHILFRATGATAIGGLQFTVDYNLANGNFEGTGFGVTCTDAIESALTAVRDRDGVKQLDLALVTPTGLALPADLWDCVFLTNATPLTLGALQITGVSATDEEAQSVSVTVSALSNGCEFGPYCGDGNVDPGEACDDGNQVAGDACTNGCTVATCGDGIVRTGIEQCDDANQASGDCCTPGCSFESGATVCRAAAGICDLAENCSDSSGSCPADGKKVSVCRAAAGICDLDEICTGSGNDCPADVKGTQVCRASSGVCDLTESCNGSSNACPSNAVQPVNTPCTSDSNACTDDKCDGAGACAHPGNAQPCDDGLFCNGADTCSGGSCSLHAGSPCPGADGDNDCTETCSELQNNCTANDTNGATCNDNNAATPVDQCFDGFCVGGSSGAVCGDADGNGVVNATDALKVLKTAVGQGGSCPLYLCDTDDNGSVQASDALRVLKKAVGQATDLDCPAPPS
jgi:cysteine-rich repeat protein